MLLEKRRVTFSRGASKFYKKAKLKSEIFLTVITKNSNREILTKNLVTFKI